MTTGPFCTSPNSADNRRLASVTVTGLISRDYRQDYAVTRTSCYTVFVSPVKRRLRNITVTLEEDAARWARIEAARQDTSVSRLLGEMLKEKMSGQDDYARAMRRALGRKPFLRSDGRYLTREETHERSRIR